MICVICGGRCSPTLQPVEVRKLCDNPTVARSARGARLRNALAAYVAKHNVDGRTEYRCSACGETKPLTLEHWSVDQA